MFSLLAVACTTGLLAQKNVVKVKPLRPIGQAVLGAPITLPLSYERVIIPRLSAQINFDYTLNSDLDVGPVDLGDINVPTVSGFGIGGEVRFYPNLTKETPRGFYLAGFLDYNRLSVESSFNYDASFNAAGNPISATLPLETTGSWSTTTYGLSIGSQWLVADRISIDVTWFGLGWGRGTAALDLEGDLEGALQNEVDQQLGAAAPTVSLGQNGVPDWSDVAAQFDNVEVDIPILNPTFESSSTATSATSEISLNIPVVRLFNFSVGFAF